MMRERERQSERERERESSIVLGEILSFESKDHGVADDQEAHGAVNSRMPCKIKFRSSTRCPDAPNYSTLVMKPSHFKHVVYARRGTRARLAAARN